MAMNTTPLELTTNKNTTENLSIITISAEDGSHISGESRKSCLFKLKIFYKRYLNFLKLVFKSIIPDLKSFKCWQVIILILFATFNVVFSILVNSFLLLLSISKTNLDFFLSKDFNSFFRPELSLIKWINELNNGVPLWRRICLCLSGIAAFTNVLNVVLVIRGKISSYFWGIIGAILYGIYSFAYGYVGDAQLYVLFFLPMQFIGIYMWSNQLDTQSTTRVKSLKLIGWIFVIILCVGLGFLFYYEIPAFSKLLTSQYFFQTSFIPHLLDALTNALSFVAQFLLILCYWEQYVLWAAVNIMGIIMYSGK
jgi:nicotinamide mononucleotide transporter PnuC